MKVAIVDYGTGNLHSVEKSFRRVASELGGINVALASSPDDILAADRIVLPGVGAFAACRNALTESGLRQPVEHSAMVRKVPLLGICVGMQLLATIGLEAGETPGFDWIPGRVENICPDDPALKIPHMGWNGLTAGRPHPLLDGISPGTDVYFVHSYHFVPDDRRDSIAHADYGGPLVAAIASGNIAGVQFHPEKSQKAGLSIIRNFLTWAPG